MIDAARDLAADAAAPRTREAYASDWAHFEAWCYRHDALPVPPSPELVGIYLADCADPARAGGAHAVSTIERRLVGITWTYRQRGLAFDRRDRHVASVLAGIRRRHARPPRQKEAVSIDDLAAMLATLGHDLRGLRDRAMLLLGFAAGLRRSELVSLDRGRDQSDDLPNGAGWVELHEDGPGARGVVLFVPGKTGWREVEVGAGARRATCPLRALRTWLDHARIDEGPLFRPVSRDGRRALDRRLADKHVARLVKRTAAAAGLRGDLPEARRLLLYGGHSLRAGLATHAEVDERHVQRQLGHASAEMTRRYQRRRDRFRVNLSKAAGM
jgi:integrase